MCLKHGKLPISFYSYDSSFLPIALSQILSTPVYTSVPHLKCTEDAQQNVANEY